MATLAWCFIVSPLIEMVDQHELMAAMRISSDRIEAAFEEQEIKCLGTIIEHEAGGEITFYRYWVGLIYKARRDDKSREWPPTFCAMPLQRHQISGLTDATGGPSDPKNLEIAADLYHDPWKKFLMPPGWQCVRNYAMSRAALKHFEKRDPHAAQKLGITSKARGYQYFRTKLRPVERFGHHFAYEEKEACKDPMPTI